MKKKKLKNISFPTGYPYILFAAGKGLKVVLVNGRRYAGN